MNENSNNTATLQHGAQYSSILQVKLAYANLVCDYNAHFI